MSRRRTIAYLCFSLSVLVVKPTKGALILNGDFDAGLTGYSAAGIVSVAGSYTYAGPSPFVSGTIAPTSGASVSEIRSTGGINTNLLEQALGLQTNALRDLSDSLTRSHPLYSVRYGSGMTTTFDGSGELSFDWNFWTEDYAPYNDLAFFTISGPGITGTDLVLLSDVNGSAEALATVTGTGPGAGTGWQGFDYTLPGTGVYTIGFGVVDGRHKSGPSYLHIDNIQASVLVPEASTAFSAGLLLLGSLGLMVRRRRPVAEREC